MTHRFKKLVSLSAAFTMLLSMTGCQAPKEQGEEKLKIRVEFDDSTSIFNYIISLRDVFPEYEFDFQSMVRRGHIDGIESTERSKIILTQTALNDDVADIVISDAFDSSLPKLTDAFFEVSGKGYTSRFQTSYLNSIAMGGKLYYLPFFIGLKGIIYNKTLFEEKGWSVPQSYTEFIGLIKDIYASGMLPISVRTMTDFGAGLFSTSYLINDGATLSGHRWQEAFSKENPAATRATFAGTLSYLHTLGEIGHIADDLALLKRPIAYLMKDREAAMCIANGESLSQVYNSGTHDKFAMMPLYSTQFPDGVIIEHNTLYLGMSAKSMADPIRAEALDKIIDYIYSEKGQLSLLETCRGMVSPCYGLMDDLSSPSLIEFKRVLEGGNLVEQVAPFMVDSSFDDAVIAFLNGDEMLASEQQILSALNRARALWLVEQGKQQDVLTTAAETFTRQQVLHLIMQALTQQTGSQIAVVPALGKPDYYGHYHDTQLARAKLYQGDVTALILESTLVRPYDVYVYQMTGQQVLSLIDRNDTNNLCYGLTPTLRYDKDRDTYLTVGAVLEGGEALDPNALYSVCAPNNISVSEKRYVEQKTFDKTLLGSLADYCASQESISPMELPESIIE